jgi:hypothetical protein
VVVGQRCGVGQMSVSAGRDGGGVQISVCHLGGNRDLVEWCESLDGILLSLLTVLSRV